MQSITLIFAVLLIIGMIMSVESQFYRLPYYRNIYPRRDFLSLLLPHEEDRYWHGYDMYGYSRTG